MRPSTLAVVAAVAACQCPDPRAQYGTSLFLIVRITPPLKVDQLTVEVPELSRPGLTQPMQPMGDLADPQTMRVLLSDSDATLAPLTVRVGGSKAGVLLASATGSAVPWRGRETDVTVVLAGGCGPGTCPGCCSGGTCLDGADPGACGTGGASCGACPGTDTCVGGGCSSCTSTCSGCCQGTLCVTAASLEHCGPAGQGCSPCNATLADRCVDGVCRCGGGPACALGAGTRCVGGACVCDPASCPQGCCDAVTGGCRTQPSPARCGRGGASCTSCEARVADRCSPAGACACGAGPPCDYGQYCDGGSCQCDVGLCDGGCCHGMSCVLAGAQSPGACGLTGAQCAACSPSAANLCLGDGGGCSCGGGPACATYQRCDGVKCVCEPGSGCAGCCLPDQRCLELGMQNASACGANGAQCQGCGAGSCVDGKCDSCACGGDECCNGASCEPADTLENCGTPLGSPCVPCDKSRADGCDGGRCRCGGGPQCPAGLVCLGGACTCTPTSCPTGCCLPDAGCSAGVGVFCGTAGNTCALCDLRRSTGCSGGSCRCGSGPGCGAGQRCLADAGCVCDPASCTGCCQGSLCVSAGAALSSCGTQGSVCKLCSSATADGCVSGACSCGAGPECGLGAFCQSGTCVCSAATGCLGCCSSGRCEPGDTEQACGQLGARCAVCLAADRCQLGRCGR